MKLINANMVFSKIDFQNDIDYNTYPKSMYECLLCKNKISFNMNNFKKHSMRDGSIFSDNEQEVIKKTIRVRNQKEPNSFIDFYCPQCNVPTRICYTAWAGGRFTGGYHLEFIII